VFIRTPVGALFNGERIWSFSMLDMNKDLTLIGTCGFISALAFNVVRSFESCFWPKIATVCISTRVSSTIWWKDLETRVRERPVGPPSVHAWVNIIVRSSGGKLEGGDMAGIRKKQIRWQRLHRRIRHWTTIRPKPKYDLKASTPNSLGNKRRKAGYPRTTYFEALMILITRRERLCTIVKFG